MTTLTAAPNLRGGRIDLAFDLDTPDDAAFPDVSLVRRRRAFPTAAADGLTILDCGELRDGAGGFWARVERWTFVIANSLAEGGLVQLRVTICFDTAASDVPARVLVAVGGDARQESFSGSTSLERGTGGTRLIFRDGLGDQGTLAWSEDATGAGQVSWTGRALVLAALTYDARLVDTAVIDGAADGGNKPQRISVRRAGVTGLLVRAEISDRIDADRGRRSLGVSVEDRSPASVGTATELERDTYYYGLFDPSAPGAPAPVARAVARATGRYGFGVDRDRPFGQQHRLYRMLPAVLQRLDEPRASDAGTGQLRSFMELFGAGLDQIRSLADGLVDRHDLDAARADLLRPLAQYVGWPIDLTRDEITQRLDIGAATRVYRTVGTLDNIRALINRATQRDVKFKEYVANVAFTNAIEPPRLNDLWQRRRAGAAWDAAPAQLALGDQRATELFLGRPSQCLDEAGGRCLAWHSPDGGSWQLQVGREATAFAPVPIDAPTGAALGEVDPCLIAAEDPARPGDLLLFATAWHDATRSDIVMHRLDSSFRPIGEPRWLTDRAGIDRWPSVVRSGGSLLLYWQSDRSGTSAIWSATLDGANPEASPIVPTRLTDGFDETPAVVLGADGAPWLFWSRDAGDRSTIWASRLAGGAWTEPAPIEIPPPGAAGRYHDRSPALARLGGDTWLAWESDRPDARRVRRPRIWARRHDGTAWQNAEIVAESQAGEGEPSLLATGAAGGVPALVLVWRSQRRSKSAWTTTVDTRDHDLLARRGAFEDQLHYTHESGRNKDDWYAGDTVGLFVDDAAGDADALARDVARMQAFVAPFKPAQVRFVWQPRLAPTP